MSDTTAVRQIKVGRIVGLSAYEIAVKNGTFTGSEEDFAKMVVTSQEQLNTITEEVNNLKSSIDSDMNEQLRTINETINQIQEKLNKINQQLPDNISISTTANKDDIIFNVK